ncbi:hypothetical protein ACFX12_039845 [Malus domestica]
MTRISTLYYILCNVYGHHRQHMFITKPTSNSPKHFHSHQSHHSKPTTLSKSTSLLPLPPPNLAPSRSPMTHWSLQPRASHWHWPGLPWRRPEMLRQ